MSYNRKVDAGFIQDIWHYGKAMQGDRASTFDCITIVDRMEAAQSAQSAIDRLNWYDPPVEWDELRPRIRNFETLDELSAAGRVLVDKCEAWGKANNIDPRTGEKPEA
jgi:hypothetical protein